jgi:uncharacterized protein
MKRWIVPVAVAGGVVTGALAMGLVALIDDSTTTQPAGAQTPTTVTGSAAVTTLKRVSVSGVGTVSGTPDVLTINLGVRTQAPSAGAALDSASLKATALIATLKQAGVAEVDISTTDVAVWPQYTNDGRQVVGYEATNSVNAKLRDLKRAGSVIDAAAGAVGDAITLGGLNFSIDDTGPLYAKARDLAVAQARTQAEQLAKAASVGLGGIVSIDESVQQYGQPVVYPAAGGAAADRASVPLQPGSQSIQLAVTVTFELV